ncbi:MAG: ABC transporter permease subunit [Opitutaceae bacterium]|jgi:iron(III) transport system permease protein
MKAGRKAKGGVAWAAWGACAFVLLTVGYPLAVLAVQAVFPEALAGSLAEAGKGFVELVRTPGLGGMLGNSLCWGAATTAGAWLLGGPAGWALARFDFPGKRLARLSLLAPVMMPPFLLALAYILLLQPGGLWEQAAGVVPAWIQKPFFGFWGVTGVMVLASYGGVALAVEAGWRGLPARAAEAAESLGARRWQVWTHILLPLLLPALVNSGVLVFVDAMSNFGVPAALGPRANLPLLPAEIHALATSWPVNLPLATALSLLLCAMAAALFQLGRVLLRKDVGGRTRGGGPAVHTLGAGGAAAVWGGFGALFIAGGGIPIGVVVTASLVERWNGGTPVWTLAHYQAVFAAGGEGRAALATSGWLAAAAATVCVLAGAMAAYATARNPGWVARLADQLGVLPRVLPSIAVAVALILAWNAPWVALPVYNTAWILLLAYLALYQGDAARLADTGMRAVGVNLEQAAELAGASRGRVWREIVLPLIRPALLAGWALTFVACMRDLVASVMLLPPGMQTAGSYIFTQFEQGDMARAMAMAVCAVTACAIMLLCLPRK